MRNFFIFFLSLIIAILTAEFLTRLYFQDDDGKAVFTDRVMLFEQGKNFKNINDFFTYYPDVAFRTKALYINKSKTIVKNEYDYYIKTNNLGLVQKTDIPNGSNVEIFVGDSFTEGQGAIPWFYKFENNWNNKDRLPINAGLPGTGPLQWYKLLVYLHKKNKFKPKRVNVILILNDLHRNVFNLHPIVTKCLHNGYCSYSLGLQGYKFNNKTEKDIKNDVLLQSNIQSPIPLELRNSNLGKVKSIIKKSYFISKIYYMFVDFKKRFPQKELISQNLDAIKDILNYGEQEGLLFIVNEKSEVTNIEKGDFLRHNYVGNKFRKLVEKHNLSFKICKLKLNDFHKFDLHPNKKGYDKVRKCVQESFN